VQDKLTFNVYIKGISHDRRKEAETITKLAQASSSPQCEEAGTEPNIRVLITVHASIVIRIIEFPVKNMLGRNLHILR
jgi:hypothetical protein